MFLLVRVLTDVFRSHDLSGAAKAAWTLVLVVFPYLGVLVYLVVRGSEMHLREYRSALVSRDVLRFLDPRARQVSVADEVAKLESLRVQGLLTEEEFSRERAHVLA